MVLLHTCYSVEQQMEQQLRTDLGNTERTIASLRQKLSEQEREIHVSDRILSSTFHPPLLTLGFT